ncbi:7384_t:CDS:2 [Diversispora eburnea]|uniref:7384_t:CDS:1 n=1 Tax=Diversispora eburnea TaxID=1213867 RepID=A0A9N9GIE4_9GLOM|nr:7384_t:CDS:2 [Diversispora eburnea]
MGIITNINKEKQEIRRAFCIRGGIEDLVIKKHISSFYINGEHANRKQFPIIVAYDLTVHKTLANISLPKCGKKGQAYGDEELRK